MQVKLTYVCVLTPASIVHNSVQKNESSTLVEFYRVDRSTHCMATVHLQQL